MIQGILTFAIEKDAGKFRNHGEAVYDGNGRTARLWQTIILAHWKDLFKYLPIESMIKKHQNKYYSVIQNCNNKGDSTEFIELMLKIINESIDDIIVNQNETTQETTQEKIIKLIKKNPKITQSQMAKQLNLTRDGIYYNIKKMKENGIIERIGSTKSGSWKIKKRNKQMKNIIDKSLAAVHTSSLKKNIKFIITIIICCILSSSLSVFAYSYFARDINYTKSDGTKINVETALNDLYNKNIKLEKIDGALNENASFLWQKKCALYKYGKYCHLTASMQEANEGKSYKIITDAKYYPKEDTKASDIGGNYSYVQYTIKTDGSIYIDNQGANSGVWASIDIWYEIK